MLLDTTASALRSNERARLPSNPILRVLDEASKLEIHLRWRMGISVEVLAKQLGFLPVVVEQAVHEVRVARVIEQELDFVYHPSFDSPDADTVIVATTHPSCDEEPSRSRPSTATTSYLDSLCAQGQLLSREQEAHLFRKMNYLKYRASKLRDRLNPVRASASTLLEIERLVTEAHEIKNQIILANLPLVVSIAKRRVGPTTPLFDLVSDGNISLVRAVERFDFSRGFKFSTYASWLIVNDLARKVSDERRWRSRFITGREELFDVAKQHNCEPSYESDDRHIHETVHLILGRLNQRERYILAGRFSIGGVSKKSLEQLGNELGISKERVRQIEARAQAKLRCFALEQGINPDAI